MSSQSKEEAVALRLQFLIYRGFCINHLVVTEERTHSDHILSASARKTEKEIIRHTTRRVAEALEEENTCRERKEVTVSGGSCVTWVVESWRTLMVDNNKANLQLPVLERQI